MCIYRSHHHHPKGSHHKNTGHDSSDEEEKDRDEEGQDLDDTELLGSDDDEQEDPKDYCKGMELRLRYVKFIDICMWFTLAPTHSSNYISGIMSTIPEYLCYSIIFDEWVGLG